ncbi:uncharacterized protein LOC143757148 [Siphateles boraxobius]|uniref:uncharacterized protein LOC143757148 n=1 Tax=Siphateles boraxobius TaxID=180520 RepID=UPI004062B86F
MVACRYHGEALPITSTPNKHQMTTHPIPALSSIIGDSSSDRDDDFEEGLGCSEFVETPIQVLETSIDWAEDRTWTPHEDTRDVSTSEEEETIEEDSDYDESDDDDYNPPLCVR